MRAHFGLPSVSNEEDKKDKPPITVKFEIPYFTVSGIQVRYLKIIEKSGYQVRRYFCYFVPRLLRQTATRTCLSNWGGQVYICVWNALAWFRSFHIAICVAGASLGTVHHAEWRLSVAHGMSLICLGETFAQRRSLVLALLVTALRVLCSGFHAKKCVAGWKMCCRVASCLFPASE